MFFNHFDLFLLNKYMLSVIIFVFGVSQRRIFCRNLNVSNECINECSLARLKKESEAPVMPISFD